MLRHSIQIKWSPGYTLTLRIYVFIIGNPLHGRGTTDTPLFMFTQGGLKRASVDGSARIASLRNAYSGRTGGKAGKARGAPATGWQQAHGVRQSETRGDQHTNFNAQGPSAPALPQLLEKSRAFYGNRRFITIFTTDHHPSLPWARCIRSTPPS